jgi:hypothetical protein
MNDDIWTVSHILIPHSTAGPFEVVVVLIEVVAKYSCYQTKTWILT